MVAAMTCMRAPRGGRGHGPAPVFVLLGSVVATLVVLGLLFSHGLNLHRTPAAQDHSAVSISLMQANRPAAEVLQPGDVTGHSANPCQGCHEEGQHLGVASGCVLALFATLLLLRRPRVGRRLKIRANRICGEVFAPIPNRLPRTLSLEALCISRR